MNTNLEINIKKYLGDDRYINYPLTLFSKGIISPWDSNDFFWEGEFENEKIIVKLFRGSSEKLAKIEKPNNLNINDQIFMELKRVLKSLK